MVLFFLMCVWQSDPVLDTCTAWNVCCCLFVSSGNMDNIRDYFTLLLFNLKFIVMKWYNNQFCKRLLCWCVLMRTVECNLFAWLLASHIMMSLFAECVCLVCVCVCVDRVKTSLRFNEWPEWCSQLFYQCKLINWLTEACLCEIKTSSFDVLTEKLSHAKEENLDMHQMLDQTLMELNNLWKHSLILQTLPPPSSHTHCGFGFLYLHLAYHKPLFSYLAHGGEQNSQMLFLLHRSAFSGSPPLDQGAKLKGSKV